MNNLGFSYPQPNQIIIHAQEENARLEVKKQRLLSELAAIENDISLFDWLDPERNKLLSSVTDVPCSTELLSAKKREKPTLDLSQASDDLSLLIEEIGSNPTSYSYIVSRPSTTCKAICNHAHVFFSQFSRMKETRLGLMTPFGVIRKSTKNYDTAPPDSNADDESQNAKRVHPMFPDIKGIRPLLGLMKEQLGEFPNYIKNSIKNLPDDEECKELRLAQLPDCLEKHLLDICGSSSDDDFNPDAPPDAFRAPVPSLVNMNTPQRL